MNNYDFNVGIWLGGAAVVISVLAAIAALYLWAVNRARQKLDKAADPQARSVIPWLSPLLLPTLVILGLGFVANLAKAYEERSWPEASNMIISAWAMFMIAMFWLKIRKQT
jgi:hypothetical protein